MNIMQARENLINNQIRPWGSLNEEANDAMMDIPRELFVPEKYKNLAFSDIEIPLSDNSYMLYPKIEGRILDAIGIKNTAKVLEIGTGSGYLTACIARLAKSVVSVEIDEKLSNNAQINLDNLQIDNAKLEVGDASKGWQSNEFFDVVVVGASVPKINGRYFHLLAVGGKIFVVEGIGKVMTAKLITRLGTNDWHTEKLFETRLKTMIGLEVADEFNF